VARQSFTWGAEPDNGNNFDLTTQLTLGLEFTVDGTRDCVGVKFRVTATLPTGPSPAFVAVWDVLDHDEPLASAAFDWSDYSDDVGTDVEVDFDTPVTLTDGAVYRVSLQSFERFVTTPGWAWPFEDEGGVLTATATNGVLAVTFAYPDLTSGAANNYFVSPIVEIDDPVEPDGAGLPSVSSTKGWLTSDSTQLGPITSSTRRGP